MKPLKKTKMNLWKKERIEKEKLEKERIEKERIEKERLEKEKIEKERIEKERLEKERIEKERIEKEKLEKERIEKERIEKERHEKERIEKERLEKEKLENIKVENAYVENINEPSEVAKLLRTIQLESFIPIFEEQKISKISTLAELNDMELKELGITKMGERKEILKAVKNFLNSGSQFVEPKHSLQPLLSEIEKVRNPKNKESQRIDSVVLAQKAILYLDERKTYDHLFSMQTKVDIGSLEQLLKSILKSVRDSRQDLLSKDINDFEILLKKKKS